MGITLKHDSNPTSSIVAASVSGEAKRRQADAIALMQNSARVYEASNRQLQGAHASPSGISSANAQLTHASPGAGVMSAPRPTGRISGTGISANRNPVSSTVPGVTTVTRGSQQTVPTPAPDVKVLGTNYFSKPIGADAEGARWVWDSATNGRWVRDWNPGEKADEAARLRDNRLHENAMEIAEQRSFLDTEREINKTRLGALVDPKTPASVYDVKDAYDSALNTANEAANRMKRSGFVSIRPSQSEIQDVSNPEVKSITENVQQDNLSSIYNGGGSVFGSGLQEYQKQDDENGKKMFGAYDSIYKMF